jgi:DNA-binding LacI/PurR family transcriptional regulator
MQMADIARLANVSISTVSRALSNSPRLSEETRNRINELARSLHYSIDAGAQSLRGKLPRTIAVTFPYHPAVRRHFQDPFFLALIGSIGDALVDMGYSMLLAGVEAPHFEAVVQPYETRQAVGTILLGQETYHRRINELAVRGLPFVVWGARLTDQLYCSVGSDNVMGGAQATDHLLACGASRIVFLGDRDLPEIGHRYQGYLDAHRRRGLEPDPALYRPVAFSEPEIRLEIDRMLDEPLGFDAVFAGSDLMALTVMSSLAARGLRIPADVQVVGFDDIAFAAYANPPLTTIRQSIDLAGRTLVERLLAKLRGETVEPAVMPTALVVRQSTRAAVA